MQNSSAGPACQRPSPNPDSNQSRERTVGWLFNPLHSGLFCSLLSAYFAIRIQLGTESTGQNNGLLCPHSLFSECLNVRCTITDCSQSVATLSVSAPPPDPIHQ